MYIVLDISISVALWMVGLKVSTLGPQIDEKN